MIVTDQQAEQIEALVVIQYWPGGRDAAGMDCLGSVLAGLEILGIEQEDPWDRLSARFDAAGWAIEEGDFPVGWEKIGPPWEPGDVLAVVHKDTGGGPSHVALMAHQGMVLWAAEKIGVCLLPLRRIERTVAWAMRRSA